MTTTTSTAPDAAAIKNARRRVRACAKRRRSTQAAYAELPPIKYGLKLWDIATGEQYFILGPSANHGAVRVQGNGPCHSHDVAVTRLTTVRPEEDVDHEFISDRVARFTMSGPARSVLESATRAERKLLISHAMDLAEKTEPTTVRSRRSLAREGAGPDTNIRAETERRHALRLEPDASKKGQPYVLMIQHQKREKKAVAK